jgi:tetratricopeptide (TPR) repeat protein
VMAFRNANFTEAIADFQKAASYDPTLLNARLYLATALAHQYVPGADTPDNIQAGKRAIAAYEDVLKLDPKNTNAFGSIGNIYFEMKNFDQAKVYQRKVMEIEPNNPDGYYWIGVLDWAIAYPRAMKLRADLKLDRPKDPAKSPDLPALPNKVREQLAEQNGPLVDEGIQNLEKAIQLRPNYASAYSYLNLMYRRKAELEASDDDRMADLKKADDLENKALALMKSAAAAKAKAANAS